MICLQGEQPKPLERHLDSHELLHTLAARYKETTEQLQTHKVSGGILSSGTDFAACGFAMNRCLLAVGPQVKTKVGDVTHVHSVVPVCVFLTDGEDRSANVDSVFLMDSEDAKLGVIVPPIVTVLIGNDKDGAGYRQLAAMVGNVGSKGSSPSVVVDASVHIRDGCNMLKDAMGAAMARTDWVTHGNPTTNKVVLVEIKCSLVGSLFCITLRCLLL